MKRLLLPAAALILMTNPVRTRADDAKQCLDGFCIGQSIRDGRFDKVDWKIPKDATKVDCKRVGCQPANAFAGYSAEDQRELADAMSWTYGLNGYTVLTKENLEALRRYRYECTASPRGKAGERRVIGLYRSTPSGYNTIVGLRLIGGELKVYRIAREFPFHNQVEFRQLASELYEKYGESILFYEGISSNAPYEVSKDGKLGWFGRSSVFNPVDLADNRAEFVLIDPATRSLLEPTSMPDSGEIQSVPAQISPQCARPMPLQ